MPKATVDDARKLSALSSDCSFLLSHLIRQNGDLTDDAASKTLRSILSIDNPDYKPILKNGATGWYSSCEAKLYQPNTQGSFKEPTKKSGVCFTDSTLAGLKAHRQVFNAKYGLAFDRDFLFSRGANPCLNIRESLFKSEIKSSKNYNRLYNYIPDALAGYVNIINESFDATHEREWRFLGNFEFEYHNIKFVFCPQSEFAVFAKIQTNGLPVLFDLMWLDRI